MSKNIAPVNLQSISANERAQLIYRSAQANLRSRLWNAALGTSAPEKIGSGRLALPANLLDAISKGSNAEHQFVKPAPQPLQQALPSANPAKPTDFPGSKVPSGSPLDPAIASVGTASPDRVLSLGVNSKYASILELAAARSNMVPETLAAIVDAESAKRSDGSWNTASRNPRSSATGLTQFIAGTWEDEAERPGTFLNGVAKANGWLNSNGNVISDHRAKLLSLRLDARCSIEAAADYASMNIEKFRQHGVHIGDDPDQVAQLAYLGHHLGPGDARDFLTTGISPRRARKLLIAQVGENEAMLRINRAGCPARAHKAWLTGYIDKRIVTSRYIENA